MACNEQFYNETLIFFPFKDLRISQGFNINFQIKSINEAIICE